jgi:hypothetical protein
MTNTYLEIDGVYIQVRERIRPLVMLLADGCSEQELRHEIQRVKPGQNPETPQLRELIDQLFSSHGLMLDESQGVWRLRPAGGGNTLSRLESALRCRITLVPEGLANRMAHALKFLYTPAGAFAAALLSALSLTLYSWQCGFRALSPGVLFQSLRQVSAAGVVICVAAIIVASFFHELGHCAAVAAFGARVRRIGFGIYWLSPALFSDVSAAWTLTRRQRVAVDCGGVYFQLLVCACYALAAAFITSPATQLALQIAIVANLVAVISALNPILKYDGYWIISDAMSIPNLRRQSEQTLRNLTRNLFAKRNRKIAVGPASRFLLGYGVLSLLYSAVLLFLFAIVIRQNAVQAIHFPKEAWTFFVTGLSSGNVAGQCAHLALDFLKVIPVACAPIALLTATTAVAGFLRRAFAN